MIFANELDRRYRDKGLVSSSCNPGNLNSDRKSSIMASAGRPALLQLICVMVDLDSIPTPATSSAMDHLAHVVPKRDGGAYPYVTFILPLPLLSLVTCLQD